MSQSTHTTMSSPTVSLSYEPTTKRSRAPLMLHRRTQIAELVQQRGFVRVDELAERFNMSEVTIRHDLAQLEQDGLLIRDRGGAVATKQVSTLVSIEQRAELNREEKCRIGRAAAELVDPGETIIVDAGTTMVEMAKYLAAVSPLTVVTNAPNVALELGAATDARVILLGGRLHRESSSTLGPLTEQSLNELVVDKVFLGAQAVDLKVGLTDTSIQIAQIKRAMLRAARQVILLTDSSKWGSTGFIKIAPLSVIQTIITDTNLPDPAQAAIKRLGINLVLV